MIDIHIIDDEEPFILVYCAAGIRSALVGHKLLKKGYKKVLNLGGYAEWIENNK